MKTRLQGLRKEAGFKSAKAFAARLEIPVGTYTDYEQGRRDFALERAWQFADVLGEALGRFVSLDELAGREWPRAPAYADPMQTELNRAFESLDNGRRKRLVEQAQDMELAKITGNLTSMNEEAV